MSNETYEDRQARRQAIAAALGYKIVAPALRTQALHGSSDYADYKRRLAMVNGVVRDRVRQARIYGARISY